LQSNKEQEVPMASSAASPPVEEEKKRSPGRKRKKQEEENGKEKEGAQRRRRRARLGMIAGPRRGRGGSISAQRMSKEETLKRMRQELLKMQRENDEVEEAEWTENVREDGTIDVLQGTGIDEEQETEAMLPKMGVAQMSEAERELEHWPNTHIIVPEKANAGFDQIVAGTRLKVDLAEGGIELIARSFQEMLCMLIPEMIGNAKHRRRTDGQKGESDETLEISLRDLELCREISRTLPVKANHDMDSPLEQNMCHVQAMKLKQ